MDFEAALRKLLDEDKSVRQHKVDTNIIKNELFLHDNAELINTVKDYAVMFGWGMDKRQFINAIRQKYNLTLPQAISTIQHLGLFT